MQIRHSSTTAILSETVGEEIISVAICGGSFYSLPGLIISQFLRQIRFNLCYFSYNFVYMNFVYMKGCICHFTKWQIHSFMAKETLWLGYVIRKQLMGLSQIEKHSRDKKNMLKSYFLLFQKRHTWGCFEEGMGYVLTVLERPNRLHRGVRSFPI